MINGTMEYDTKIARSEEVKCDWFFSFYQHRCILFSNCRIYFLQLHNFKQTTNSFFFCGQTTDSFGYSLATS